MIDMEYSTSSDESAEHAVRAAESSGIHIVARAGQRELPRPARFLDAGGEGVITARVTSEDDARSVIAACRLPPLGARGARATRAANYGLCATSHEWMLDASNRVTVGVQIEDHGGVESASAIAALDGLDLLMVGPRDLSIDLDVAGKYDDPLMRTEVDRIAQVCTEAGMSWAMPTDGPLTSGYNRRVRLLGLSTILSTALQRPHLSQAEMVPDIGSIGTSADMHAHSA